MKDGQLPIIQDYVNRDARGSIDHSEHAHGIALDAWPSQNPFVRTDGSKRPKLATNFDMFSRADGRSFVNWAKKMGFPWGADWSTDMKIGRGSGRRRRHRKHQHRNTGATRATRALVSIPMLRTTTALADLGTGPSTAGRVEVVGPDEYDLDGDGVGCE